MPSSPVSIILEMVTLLIRDILNTFQGIFRLFGSLLESLGIVTAEGGTIGFLASLLILGVVGFFLARFLFGGAFRLILLFVVGIVLAYILILASFL